MKVYTLFFLVFSGLVLRLGAATAVYPDVGAISYHWQTSATNPGLVEIYADAVTQPDWQGNYRDLKLQISVGGNDNFPGNYTTGIRPGEYTTVTSGQQFWVRACWNATGVSSNVYGPHGSDASPPEYGAKFVIPANNTDHPITYTTSNGGSFVQPSGAGPTLFTVSGLSSNAPITLSETTTGAAVGGGGVWESSPSGSYSREVSTAVPVQTNGSNPQVPAGTPSTAPDQPTPSGDAPAPTQRTTRTVNRNVYSSKSDVASQPGGTSDMSLAGYREGVDKLTDAQKEGSAAVVAAIQSASAAQSTRDGVRNVKLDELLTKVQGSPVAPPSDIQVPDPVVLGESTVAAKLFSKLPVAPAIQLPSSRTSFSFVLNLPGLASQTVAVNLEDYAPGISIFRGLVLAAMAVGFFFLVLKAVRDAFA